MILGADEHLDRINPEKCSSHSSDNLSNRLLQRALRMPAELADASTSSH
jgi:hypothetical protein